MNKQLKVFLAAATLLGAGAVNAAVIDFDNDYPTYFGTATWSQANFTVTSNQPDGTIVDHNNTVRGNLYAPGIGNDTQSMFWGANGATSTLTITNDSSLAFSALSFDASSLYNASGALSVTGFFAGGGSITQNLSLTSDLSLYALTGMTGLSSLEISFDGNTYFAPYDIDNIVVNAVPVPAAVWLMGSALGLLVAARRRKA